MKLKINYFIRHLKHFCSKPQSTGEKLNFVKVNDLKNFGKQFSVEDKEKYMDPFGFLSPNDYKEVVKIDVSDKVANKEDKPQNEQLKKLEQIEKIQDPIIKADEKSKNMPKEYGYKYRGPEPTRYGDWEIKGKCSDF